MAASEQWAETGVGAVVLAAAGGFLIYALSAGGPGLKGGDYQVSARFGQVGTLAAGADVRLAGVKIGTVSKITLDPKTYLADAQISLNKEIKVPADSTAKITSDGLLGGAHISIEPGGATEDLKPGAQFENTQGAIDMLGMIGQFVRSSGSSPSGAGQAAAPAAAAPAKAAAASDPYPAQD